MSAKLLPCPFCGLELIPSNNFKYYMIHPKSNCFFSETGLDPRRWGTEWNRRHTIEAGRTAPNCVIMQCRLYGGLSKRCKLNNRMVCGNLPCTLSAQHNNANDGGNVCLKTIIEERRYMYKRVSHSQAVHNILFKDMLMSPESFLIVSDVVTADHIVDVLNAALNIKESANTSTNNARDEILLCAGYSPQCSHGLMVCQDTSGKCTSQRKTSPIA